MTSRGGAAIAWTSDNLPVSIAHTNGNNSLFFHGPAGNRWKQVAKHGAATETTVYAGGQFEKVTRGGVTTWRHYVPSPGGVALHLRYSDGTPAAMRYLTLDHLGSTDRIVDSTGKVLVAESFAALGSRRNAALDRTTGCGRARQDCGIHARRLHRSRATRQSRPHSHERPSLRPQARALHQRGSLRHASLRQPGTQSLHVLIEQSARIHRSERIRPGSLRGDAVW